MRVIWLAVTPANSICRWRSLARVEQQALVVPAQEVAVVIAAAGGRLARRAEDHHSRLDTAPFLVTWQEREQYD